MGLGKVASCGSKLFRRCWKTTAAAPAASEQQQAADKTLLPEPAEKKAPATTEAPPATDAPAETANKETSAGDAGGDTTQPQESKDDTKVEKPPTADVKSSEQIPSAAEAPKADDVEVKPEPVVADSTPKSSGTPAVVDASATGNLQSALEQRISEEQNGPQIGKGLFVAAQCCLGQGNVEALTEEVVMQKDQ